MKGGDPFVFGRGGEELAALRAAGIAAEVIPGVTAGIAAPAALGIPITHRGLARGAIFVTGHGAGGGEPDWERLAGCGLTLVIYMGLARLEHIVARLLDGGLMACTPAALISDATLATEHAVRDHLGRVARGCCGGSRSGDRRRRRSRRPRGPRPDRARRRRGRMTRSRLVVVGNGMAGVRTLEELLRLAPGRYDITVFGAEPHPNYNRILLSPVLAGELSTDEIVINDREWYAKNGITLHLGRARRAHRPLPPDGGRGGRRRGAVRPAAARDRIDAGRAAGPGRESVRAC